MTTQDTGSRTPLPHIASHPLPAVAPPCLSVWVIGNPTSGGKRGAVVLGRLAKLFQKTYGAEAVQETCSSRFLSLAFPAHAVFSSSCSSTATTATPTCNAIHSADVFSCLPSLDMIWASGTAPSTAVAGPTPPITPPSSPNNVFSASASNSSPASSCSSSFSYSALVRTMLIHTDQSGHAKPVSNALSRLILRSRLTNQRMSQCEQENEVQTLSGKKEKGGASSAASSSAFHAPSHLSETPRSQHLVLVVGGDGTLSEVVNGLCEGTLAGYRHFTAALHNGRSDNMWAAEVVHSSHAHVEQEAAVLTRLLPAVLYVPGGTGADFAKLGLCCPTPEAALHVVRDGVVKMLFRGPRSGTAPSSSAPDDPACYACPLDVGRIEFISTGTRRFFINIASIGMSCDVIGRGERFKHSKVVSKLGGTLLFALSAFISLLLMKPKPLCLCRLPPRRARTAAAAVARDGELVKQNGDDGGAFTLRATENDIKRNPTCNGVTVSTAEEQPLQQDFCEAGTTLKKDSLLLLPAFTPLEEQLKCLQEELPVPADDACVGRLCSSAEACLFSSLHGDSVYCPRLDESAYQCHVAASMPPPHAKTVQCTTQATSSEVRQLLDISEYDLRVLRRQQARQLQQMVTTRQAIPAERSSEVRGRSLNGLATHASHRSAPQGQLSATTQRKAAVVTQRVVGTTQVSDKDDDLSALTWVELPSSMLAFANGRWFGGGMHVAPHANPTDGLLSCTNWVATVLPFVSGVLSLYTGRHLRWSSTSAFEGERFLVSNAPPTSTDFAEEPLYMEADGERLEAIPAIVELAGKLTFIIPRAGRLCVGDPAPGTTRARLDEAAAAAAAAEAAADASRFFFADRAAQTSTMDSRLRRVLSGFGALWRRSWSYAQRWASGDGRGRSDNAKQISNVVAAPASGGAGATRRTRDGIAVDVV